MFDTEDELLDMIVKLINIRKGLMNEIIYIESVEQELRKKLQDLQEARMTA